MTNEMIILLESVKLMEQGVLKGTGRTVEIQAKDGSIKRLEIPEEIHTFEEWKHHGFSVKRGEHAKAKFCIWIKAKAKARTDGDEEETVAEKQGNKFRLKMSYFFTRDQVEPLKVRTANGAA